MKDLIIGCSDRYNWNKIKYWVNSVDKSGFTGDKLIIFGNVDKNTIQECVNRGWIVSFIGTPDNSGNYVYQNRMSIAVDRFLAIWQVLHQIGNNYEYVIHTDVKDVVFQLNPSVGIRGLLGGNKKFLVSSESLKYCDEPWGQQNMIDTFGQGYYSIHKDDEIFNMGVTAGTSKIMMDMAKTVFQLSMSRSIPNADQACLNFLLQTEAWANITKFVRSEDGFAAQTGTTMDESKIANFAPKLLEPAPIWDGSVVRTSTGMTHYILHQYDRVKSIRDAIYQKYDDTV
jgi:hypothetical protein